MGLFGALFDFSFSQFVTTRLVRFLYGMLVVIDVLVTLVVIVRAFGEGAGAGLVALILAPILLLILVVITRVYLEIIIVIFRIAEYLREMSGRGGAEQSGSAQRVE